MESFRELEAYSEQAPERPLLERREPLAAELEEFVKAVRGEPAEIVTGEEGTRSIEIATEIAERAGRR